MENMAVYAFILALTAPLLALQVKMMVWPDHVGWVKRIDSPMHCVGDHCKTCGSCPNSTTDFTRSEDEELASFSDKVAKMGIDVTVELEDGSELAAEVSCCNICIEKIGVGSRVAISKIGSRYQVHPYIGIGRAR